MQAASYAKGKTIPLNIVIEAINNGAKVSMTYATPPATLSPESAIKNQFCQTIQAAANSAGKPAQAVVADDKKSSGQDVAQMGQDLQGINLSKQQKNQLATQLSLKNKEAQLKTMIAEASPTIEKVLAMQACFYPSSSYGMYRSSGGYYQSLNNYAFNHHDKSKCVNVQRIKDWKIIAKNALFFRVVYVSEQSGESQELYYEVQKQLDDVWLFN